MYFATASSESISAVSDLFGAMVQAGAALVAIVGGVVGARYVAVHTRRHELAVDIDTHAQHSKWSRENREHYLQQIAGREGQVWVWRPDRLRLIAEGNASMVELQAADLPDEHVRYGAEREIDALRASVDYYRVSVERLEYSADELAQDAVRTSHSPIGVLALFALNVESAPTFGLGAAAGEAARRRLADQIAGARDILNDADAEDRAKILEAEARGDAASDLWQDRHAVLIALSESGEYGVALKVLGMTTLITVVVPLAVMIIRPGDSLTLRLVGAVVFLAGIGCLARYLWIYARFLMSPDDTMRLPSGFWQLMTRGAQPLPRNE